MSNKKRLPRPDSARQVGDIAAEASCSDCGGRPLVKSGRAGFTVTLLHDEGCPAYSGAISTLHKDAGEAVRRAAAKTGLPLEYRPVSNVQGEVLGVSGEISTGS